MKPVVIFWVATLLVLAGAGPTNTAEAAGTIDQKLVIVQRDTNVGGHFNIAVQVKGTGLGTANTLGSATIDIQFDRTALTYVNATGWAFGSADGYNRSANNDTTFIRLAITGGGVNENNDGTPAGFDIASTYTTWVQLNFTIASTTGIYPLTILPGSNAVSLYVNHGNDPNTGVLASQQLSPPINITGPTSVEEGRGIPTTFALDQNFPNPFNPATTIEFALPHQGHVTLEVFNILGQKVATLVDEARPAGYYTVKFNGAGLASGLYFYRLSAGEATLLKKMLMIK
jgi:hypothetical protein